jgi:hypothetical protein
MKLKTAEISASLRTLFKFAVKDPVDPVDEVSLCSYEKKLRVPVYVLYL